MKNRITNLVSNAQKTFLMIASMLVLVLGLSALSSCNKKPEDTKAVAEEHNEAKFDKAEEADAQYLVAAAEINLEEIQLGALAQEKSAMVNVKDLGKMMQTGHSKALDELKTLAAKKQITIPTMLTDNGKEAETELMKKNGRDFDKNYCNRMVSGHKSAIDRFEKIAKDATDADIRNWASSLLPALRSHLDHAITCQKECEKM